MSRSPGEEPEEPEEILTSEERRRQVLQALGATALPETISWGERILPFLFAAMETCWVDAILIALASMNLFQSHDPVFPLWGPFVYIAGSYWLYAYLERRAAKMPIQDRSEENKALPGTPLLITILAILTVFVTWLCVYTSTAFFLDPRWIQALLNDILLFNRHFYQILAVVVFSLYFCWRGIRMAYRNFEPSDAFRALRLGTGIMIAVVVIRAGQQSIGLVFNDELALLLLIPIFLYLSLSAHGLAQISFVRRSHPVGLHGDVDRQERAIVTTIGSVGIVLMLVAFGVGLFASPSVFAGVITGTQAIFGVLAVVYTWVASALAQVAVWLLTPVFWLVSWIISLGKPVKPSQPTGGKQNLDAARPPLLSNQLLVIAAVVKFVLPFLILLVVVLLLWWVLRHRRRVRVEVNRRLEELHESLWSWQLFWSQLKTFFLGLFKRLRRQRATQEEEADFTEEITGEAQARTIREIYRALLRWAGSRGYPRRRDETPYEFQQRLDTHLPMTEPQLATVTEAYTATRYGEVVPDDAEVGHIRQVWAELQQKSR